MKSKSLKKKLGQNTAEYLIMLTLVAVGSIGLFSVFGKTLRHKISYVTAAISGETANFDAAKTSATAASGEAKTRSDKEVKMEGQESSELSSGTN